jgi:phospholipid/cholesterol/gamma-HCH transport system permease protein
MATAATPAPGAAPLGAPAELARPAGRGVEFLREMGDLVLFTGRALAAIPGSLRYASEGLRQGAMMLRGTVFLVFVMEIFLGFTTTNFAFFFLRSIGASDYMGIVSGYAGPRQLAPSMFAYVFTARVCCGMAAELGAMKIQQEIDALESTGVDPLRYLVGTRLLGVLIFLPVATVVALVAILIGIYLNTVTVLHGIAPHVLLDVNWSVQTIADQLISMLTMSAIAVVTAIVACFYGLRTTGGPAAVGSSVARSLYLNLVLLHVIGVFFAVFFYGTTLHLPIGG